MIVKEEYRFFSAEKLGKRGVCRLFAKVGTVLLEEQGDGVFLDWTM